MWFVIEETPTESVAPPASATRAASQTPDLLVADSANAAYSDSAPSAKARRTGSHRNVSVYRAVPAHLQRNAVKANEIKSSPMAESSSDHLCAADVDATFVYMGYRGAGSRRQPPW